MQPRARMFKNRGFFAFFRAIFTGIAGDVAMSAKPNATRD
jgi:hypothetical protein